jgi:hypothetical protein
VPLPTGEVLVASGPLGESADGALLPPDTAAWVRP